jgi:threonine dehydratase
VDIRFADILLAHRQLRGRVRETPLSPEPVLSEARGAPVRLKLECWQVTGSFKYRGALSRVLALTPEERDRGLLAVSAGNHALGVAAAAGELGLDLLVVMPRHAPAVKVAGVERLGARVELRGENYDEAEAAARIRLAESGRTLVHPFEDRLVIAGQGTVGLEIALEGPPPDVVVVPAGGGGLIVGTAIAVKTLLPGTRVVGVQSEASAPLVAGFAAGRHVPVEYAPSIADGLFGDTTPAMIDLAVRHVDAFVAVSEAAIRRAIGHLFRAQRLVVEGSGAVAVAALMEGLVEPGSAVAVVTGSNIDPAPFLDIVSGGATG